MTIINHVGSTPEGKSNVFNIFSFVFLSQTFLVLLFQLPEIQLSCWKCPMVKYKKIDVQCKNNRETV